MVKPLSKEEFFRQFEKICNKRVAEGKVKCAGCGGEAKLVAILTLPGRGDFTEINCPRCGEMYIGIDVRRNTS